MPPPVTTPSAIKKPWQGLQNRLSGRRNNASSSDTNPVNNNTAITPRSSSSSLSSMSRNRSDTNLKETASTKTHDTLPSPQPPLSDDACMIDAIHYRGLDVIFVCTVTVTHLPQVLVIAARSRTVLQKLTVPTDAGNIVAITSHAVSGMVCIAFADGRVCTFFPKPAKAVPTRDIDGDKSIRTATMDYQQHRPYSLMDEEVNCRDSKVPVTVFGRYFWVTGVTAHCRSVFYAKDELLGENIFARTHNITEKEPKRVNISISVDSKLLVGHRDQLAVFDASPCDSPDVSAILNWTFRLRNYIAIAKISGDALAIAYVLHGDNKHGVYTLIRERGLADMDNDLDIDIDSKSTRSIGPVLTALFYKAGPFLAHTSIVTRLSFRGKGFLNMKVVQDEEEEGVTLYGNDLLLTTCATDGSMRIFGQSTWKQLYQWDTPPGNSRADWIQGITYFNVAELEALQNNTNPMVPKTITSSDDKSTSSFSESLRDLKNKHHLQSGNVTSQAGAWISELTFRGTEPALRLSRLSFVKSGGNDFTPAHFESIIATLPPGTISPVSVQRFLGGNEDSSLIVHGVWPAWDPCEGNTGTMFHDENATASSSTPVRSNTTVTAAGVTHLPPTELRMYASDVMSDNLILLECPLWGDKDNGEFELGSPLRYALKIRDVDTSDISKKENDSSRNPNNDPSTSVDFKAGRLCALIHSDRCRFEILWRSQGTMNILHNDLSSSTETFVDLSATPLALSITTGSLPEKLVADVITFADWWIDENFGDSCRLVLLTKSGAIVVYEIPPLWSALEPIPSSEITIEYSESVGNLLSLSGKRIDRGYSGFGQNEGKIYEVEIMPHPEFGIGIRLDVHREGNRIIVGSFKKHPLSGGMLPAEKSGKIKVGDVVLKVNNISFEGKSMNDTIETMRSLGSKNPLTMVFRTFDQAIDSKSVETKSVIGHHGLQCINTLAMVRNAIVGGHCDDISSFILLPRQYGQNIPKSQRSFLGSTPFLYASNGVLTASWLHISNENGADINASNVTKAGSIDLNCYQSTPKCPRIVDMEVLQNLSSSWSVAACDENGSIFIILIQIRLHDSTEPFPSLDMQAVDTIDIAKSDNAIGMARSSFLLRTYSVELFATFRLRTDIVHIWLSSPIGKFTARAQSTESHGSDSKYKCLSIRAHGEILDLQLIRSGFLDAFPWLVIAATNSISLYRFSLKTSTWCSVLEVKYAGTDFASTFRPLDRYPHLIPSLYRMMSSSDESSIYRTDWHPDAIISDLCTHQLGIADAMKRSIPQLYAWLSGLNEQSSSVVTNRPNNLACAPTSFYFNDIVSKSSHTDAQNQSHSRENSSFGNDNDLSNFIDRLHDVIESMETLKISSDAPSKKGSKYFQSAMYSSKKGLKSDSKILLDIFKDMTREDMHLLWSIGKVMLKSRDYGKIDRQGQITCFSIDLMRQLEEKQQDKCVNTPDSSNVVASSPMEQSTSTSQSSIANARIASAACLSALLSNTQGSIIKASRSLDDKMDWPTARSLMLPFWLRSDKLLRSIIEEIGLEVYRKTRDVMECAIFMISSGNIKKLKALAATDRSDSGRKFLSFITDNDFSSQRGRAAAEKNAFSLLRKRRYMVSAAFFLLAQPPMLKNAFEIILTQLDDPSLAFMIARLMGDSTAYPADSLQQFSMGSLRGLGGGGGFASASTDYDDSSKTDFDEKFTEWKPVLTDSMRYVLSSRCLSFSAKDPCFQAAILVWLNRPNDAALCLIGRAYNTSRSYDEVLVDSTTRFLYDEEENTVPDSSTITRINSLIGFVCRPFLLSIMEAPLPIVTASALASSDALHRRGLEIPSLQILLGLSTERPSKDESDKVETTAVHLKSTLVKNKSPSEAESNSIFDSFNVPQRKKVTPSPTKPVGSTDASSSIFDTFSVPAISSKSKQNVAAPTEDSSIFDSFSVPTKKKPPNRDTSSANDSSIFDSFAPPPRKDTKHTPTSDASSTIFDSFAVPMQTKKVASEPATPSIFDSFDLRPQVTSRRQDNSSSIFDNFEEPLKKTFADNSVNESKKMNSSCKFNLEEEPKDTVMCETTDDSTFINILKTNIIRASAARRLLREIARILAPFQGDIQYDVMGKFCRPIHPLLPARCAKMLANEKVNVTDSIKIVLDNLCSVARLDREEVLDEALLSIGCPTRPRRIVFSVLLLCLKGRFDLIEDILREAAHELVRHCDMFTISNDDLTYYQMSKHYASSQFVRRFAVVTSLQLEFCLWLHRSLIFPLSASVLKEVSVGVRVGFLVASWGRCHETLDGMIRSNPDCNMDQIRGRQLWSSIKIMNTSPDSDKKTGLSCTGGWEFLVDCRRAEATDMLRDRKPGSFLIRPHAGDQGVFTLSFKTNLLPTDLSDDGENRPNKKILGKLESSLVEPSTSSLAPSRDDIVQHAIIRLSDAGFRCGHFGPFPSLQQLLEEISSSLPFNLLFSDPPSMAIIRNKSDQPSPNAAFIRKMALHGTSEHLKWNAETRFVDFDEKKLEGNEFHFSPSQSADERGCLPTSHLRPCNLTMISGMFSQLLTLAEMRKQVCAIVAADYDLSKQAMHNSTISINGNQSISEATIGNDAYYFDYGEEDFDVQTSRIVRPLLNWCRSLECVIVNEIAPQNSDIWRNRSGTNRIAVAASDTEVEAIPSETKNSISRGDALIRLMIQPSSGVTFRTMRVGDGSQSAVVVLFSRKEAIAWLISIGIDKDEEEAGKRLDLMERRRVIEMIELNDNAVGSKPPSVTINSDTVVTSNQPIDTRYRFVDPWEVEVLESKEGDSRAAALGRGHYTPSTIENVAQASESVQRSLGGLHLVELWTTLKGGITLTKSLASVYPPWERDAGGDSPIGFETQFSNFSNSISQHLYRNALFRRMGLPQRFMAVINAELLDLKNLTSPTGASPVVAFALARLKRSSSNAPLSLKTRTIDSACTEPKKIGKASGPNAPGTWGCLVRFRFPLPEDVDCDGLSFDQDREALFNGIPSFLQVSVYEKKFMTDSLLGGADVNLEALPGDSHVVEWVPLRSSQQANVTWFIRIRLSLRFELMCLEENDPVISADMESRCPSVAVKRLKVLSSIGGAHEDNKGFRKILSAPDLPDHSE